MNAFRNRIAMIFRALAQHRAIAGHAGYCVTLRRLVFGTLGFLPLMLPATPVSAAAFLDVNVDLEGPGQTTYSGTGVSPDTGTFWNGNANSRGTGGGPTVTSGFLTASDGSTVTGEQFTLGNFSQTAVPGTVVAPALFADYVYDTTNSNAVPGTFAITGLTSGATYNLYLYSMTNYDPVSGNTVFTIDGLAGSSTTLTGRPVTDGITNSFVQVPVGNPGGQTIGNYVLYPFVVATGGQISGTFAGTNERFNGFQIQQVVPEPSSVVLLGLSAAGWLAIGVSSKNRKRAGAATKRRLGSLVRTIGIAGMLMLALFCGLGNVSAAVINVDFNGSPPFSPATGTYNALGAAPDSPSNTNWNGVAIGTDGTGTASFTSSALTASDGSTTPVTFTLGNFNTLDASGQYASPGPYITVSANALFGDFAYNGGPSGSTATFSINNLTSGGHYNLYLYSFTGYPNNNDTDFTINGVAGSTRVHGDPSVLADAALTTGFVPAVTGNSSGSLGNYVLYSDLVATGGTISGTFSGTNVRFDGFQILPNVPEPSSVVLIGLSSVGLIAIARRRRQTAKSVR